MNSLVLAYLGDAVYELWIREYLINTGLVKVNDLQKESMKYVSAKSQVSHLHRLLAENIFTDHLTIQVVANIIFITKKKWLTKQ